MEAEPPTYDRATHSDHWDIIASYIPTDDLCSVALVSRAWHATFVPHLWGNPASHFGVDNDAVYVALTRFKLTLRTARLLVRALTHTLHLPPAHAELYNGPHADWLRDILDRLPNLQSLIVRGLPFFDHSALQALKYKPPKPEEHDVPAGVLELPGSIGVGLQSSLGFTPAFGLRFLDASRCPNVTSGPLAEALQRFEGLLYLDLSFTPPARDPAVLKSLRRSHGLQVLKLRGIHLNDDGLAVLASTIGCRVRSVDLRDNHITDKGVRTLLDKCFSLSRAGRESFGLIPYMGLEMLAIYQGEDFEGYLRSMFTQSFIGRLAIEDAPEGGITHLYIANNQLTVEGVSGLIRSRRLHVLDVQGVVCDFVGSTSDDDDEVIRVPGVEKLISVLYRDGAERMTFLRVDHAIVTKDVPEQYLNGVVYGRGELADTSTLPHPAHGALEIDGTSVQPVRVELPEESTPVYELEGDTIESALIYEMDADTGPATPVFELEGSSSPIQLDPRAAFPLVSQDYTQSRSDRRSSLNAPEVVESSHEALQINDLVSPISPSADLGTMMSDMSLMTPASPFGPLLEPPSQIGNTSGAHRSRGYSAVATERVARLNAHMNAKHNLHPAMLPNLRTLILTNVPPTSSTLDLSTRIITLVKQCGEEAALAKSHARVDYAQPPGRRGHVAALKQSAQKMFALERIILEMGHDAPALQSPTVKHSGRWHPNTRSVTEDRDSESLWSAGDTDFSFFGADEELALPTLNYSRSPTQGWHGKDQSSDALSNGHSQPRTCSPEPQYNTVALLSSFRRERKAAHLRSLAAGAVDPETEGYWDGVIQVVHPLASDIPKDEELDYYGNRFQNR